MAYSFFFSLFVDPELHNTCWLKKDVSDRIDKEGVTSGFITDECKGKKIRLKKNTYMTVILPLTHLVIFFQTQISLFL